MKTCEAYQEMISRLLDEDLSAEEQSELERHAASCPDCAAMLAAFRSLSEAISDDPAEPPEGLHENIMADVRREAIRRRQAPRRVRNFLALAACAALVILAAANLPRMGASGPKLAAAPAAARDETYVAVQYAETEEASNDAAAPEAAFDEAAPAEAVPAEPALGAAAPDAVASGEAAPDEELPAEAAPMPEPEAAPMPEPEPEPEAVPPDAPLGYADEMPSATFTPGFSPVWPYVLVGLLAVGGALLLLRRPKRK